MHNILRKRSLWATGLGKRSAIFPAQTICHFNNSVQHTLDPTALLGARQCSTPRNFMREMKYPYQDRDVEYSPYRLRRRRDPVLPDNWQHPLLVIIVVHIYAVLLIWSITYIMYRISWKLIRACWAVYAAKSCLCDIQYPIHHRDEHKSLRNSSPGLNLDQWVSRSIDTNLVRCLWGMWRPWVIGNNSHMLNEDTRELADCKHGMEVYHPHCNYQKSGSWDRGYWRTNPGVS